MHPLGAAALANAWSKVIPRRQERGQYPWTSRSITLIANGFGLFTIFLDALIVNVALPSIQAGFAVGEAGLQWVVAAYSLGMAVFIMTAATLADLHGRRRWYVIAICLQPALAPSLEVLKVARGTPGVAAATVNVTSLALVIGEFVSPLKPYQASS